MKNAWKWIVVLLALCAVCGAWFYYETELELSRLLPQESWTGVTLYEERYGGYTEKTVELDAVLEAIDSTTLDRGQEFHLLPSPFYMMYLARPAGPSILIYALEDGRVSMAIESGKYQYFENGEELYAALEALAASE